MNENTLVCGSVKVQWITIESVTEWITLFTFDECHQIHVVGLFVTRYNPKQIWLLLVQFLNLRFQNVPLIKCHTYARLGGLFYFRVWWVEKSSNIHVRVFIADRNINTPTDVMMEVDALSFLLSSDAVVNIPD